MNLCPMYIFAGVVLFIGWANFWMNFWFNASKGSGWGFWGFPVAVAFVFFPVFVVVTIGINH